jgi:tetratricopeptide (TPR) repeat protein
MKHLHEALAVTDLTDQAHTHHEIAWAWEKQGNDQQALFHATCALDLYRVLGNAEWESQGLNQVGWYAARLGDYETARTHCQAALTLNKHHPASAAATLDSLGYIEYHTGHHHEAVEYYEQAAAACRSLGYTYQSALTLDRLGHPYAALGQNEHARAVWQQAIELYRQQGRFEDAERTQQQLDALDRSA